MIGCALSAGQPRANSERLNSKDRLMIENLSTKQMEGILEALPFDISFVDEDDTVKYWNKHNKRMFNRSIKALGKAVQDCHPPGSVNSVNQVLTDLKNGEREVVNFRTELNGRDIYIRYFPVRDTDGKYIGTLEVEQDITDM